MRNYRILPKVRDSWSYLYVEHARIDQEDMGICLHDARGRVHVPCASLSLLMLGPGTSITHAAVMTTSEAGCLIAWCGEQGIRFYAQGLGETRSSANLLRQAALWADEGKRLMVVRRMYEMRFPERLEPNLTLRQIRGKEGARVRDAYAKASRTYGVPWFGRNYDRKDWDRSDPINRAISAANACLYGVVHAAVVASGYSPALGFIHTGKMLSFVYDVADLYKTETVIPAAFLETGRGEVDLESRVRRCCRDLFVEIRLLQRIVNDLDSLFDLEHRDEAPDVDLEKAFPGQIWDPEGNVSGGHNYSGRKQR
ncbi:MAG: type I-E CRISPR-associated endonuclease Cas1e [Bacillota bacterium]|jgi:CRISPR-associated protein Cas1